MKFTPTSFAHGILQDGRGTRTKSREAWSAVSADGRWEAERLDEPGTPWALRRKADGRVAGASFGSLKAVEKAVASGAADRMADQCDACHGAGGENVEIEAPVWGWGGWKGGRSEWRPCACCGGSGRWKAPEASDAAA
ncbi:MAG: hypothetical protein EKK55_13520 [Rhodocyclaceae bacterium]|nr:MAG: hypothetical protein EKK55_13520 [Rhodocyclaceae bacterium]